MSITASVNLPDFDQLPHYQKRRFLPETADLRDKAQVVVLYQRLCERQVHSREAFEKWLNDRSELEAAVDQAGAVLYIKMTIATDNPEFAKAYEDFISQVIPAVKPWEDRLNKQYHHWSVQYPLDAQRYAVYDRRIKNDLELYREQNIPLETKIQLLSQEYQKICGAMTVHFQDAEYTLPQMQKFLDASDRFLREEAWRATANRRLQDRERLDEIYDQMLHLRNTLAINTGFSSFIDYQFRVYHRFDYTPAQCREYHHTVEALVVPVWQAILRRRQQQMHLEHLRPWDLKVDPLGRPPLRPFSDVQTLITGVCEIFQRLDPSLGVSFRKLAENGLLDLASRKGKAPGGYQNTLAESRQPFIFMNAVGVEDDVRTLLHESGHAFHALACVDDPLHVYRHAPLEFCEVASMGMELLAEQHLSVFYSPDDVRRSCQLHMEGIVYVLVWVAVVDAFQHWIYTHPKHSRQERTSAWLEIYQRFQGRVIDWSGLENEQAALWHRQLHIFEVPFYYIEYGIAQLGALQLWLHAKQDIHKTLQQYHAALALGGSRPLPELFQAAGLPFDFSEKTMVPLIKEIQKVLALDEKRD
jgi:oligoendopeptidase F